MKALFGNPYPALGEEGVKSTSMATRYLCAEEVDICIAPAISRTVGVEECRSKYLSIYSLIWDISSGLLLLMLMNDAEIAEVNPDYIILDEFHRCGAEQWGKGVQKLLNMYDGVPVLGLSATNIRYLDNQRDMADELFDGNIASEMTLGEAIVRGILNPPTYVISVYSYQKDLERYRQRIYRAKNKAVRDAAQKYLDELRRTLEKADGLDVIFQKHITDRDGKYIVFCSGVEHMDEMISHVPEWFSSIDRSPHIYRAYSDDPETGKAFSEFKSDNSTHLKLLFCIDMSRGYAAYGLLENLALYRMSSSSMTGNKMKAARDQWDTYRKYYKFSLVKSAYFFCWYAFNAIKRKLF